MRWTKLTHKVPPNSKSATRFDCLSAHLLISHILWNWKEIRVIFCDISKAFDRVWHRGLILKLHVAGIRSSLKDWFEKYLYNRKQRVCIKYQYHRNGGASRLCSGTSIILIYINDIVTDVNSSIKLLADDTSLSLIVDDPIVTACICLKGQQDYIPL